MLKITKADGQSERALIDELRARSGEVDRQVTAAVEEILQTVRQKGDEAVRAYTEKFDGKAPEKAELTRADMKAGMKVCDAAFLSALERAADNIRVFHEKQKQQSWLDPQADGVILGQRIRGLHRVGIYVPGGTAAYPSSVLMNAIPAKIAGVGEIVMVTPPLKNG
ncbi:MAG: histidinol dehydrogenase, partial [Clostridiales bacterium]|nr:histidinol dehydrogenase [Clostridiales bacterium]